MRNFSFSLYFTLILSAFFAGSTSSAENSENKNNISINILSGELRYSAEIFNMNNGHKWLRNYSSQSLRRGTLGLGWCHSLDSHLVINKDKTIHIKDCELPKSSVKIAKKGNRYKYKNRTYNSNGRLIEWMGYSLYYNNNGLPIRLISKIKHDSFKIEYNPLGFVSKISNNSNQIHFHYKDGELSQVVNNHSSNFKYTYDIVSNLVRVNNSTTGVSTIKYDLSSDRATQLKVSKGCITKLKFESLTNTKIKICPDKSEKNLVYRLPNKLVLERYNKKNNNWNLLEQKSTVFWPTGEIKTYSGTLFGRKTFEFTANYDSKGNLISYSDSSNNMFTDEDLKKERNISSSQKKLRDTLEFN